MCVHVCAFVLHACMRVSICCLRDSMLFVFARVLLCARGVPMQLCSLYVFFFLQDGPTPVKNIVVQFVCTVVGVLHIQFQVVSSILGPL